MGRRSAPGQQPGQGRPGAALARSGGAEDPIFPFFRRRRQPETTRDAFAMSAALDQLRHQLSNLTGHAAGLRAGTGAPAPVGWSYAALAGRLVELSAGWNSAALTLATSLVWQAQRAGEPTAWITREADAFFPPDAAANGVDLAALAVVRVPGNNTARAPGNDSGREPAMWAVARAAGRLARSGAFGLIVLDLGARARMSAALQGSLVQQAQRHGTAIVCLTEKPPRSSSLGALVALRGQARRHRMGEARFACVLEICKDKRRGPGWTHEEEAHGPPGLR